MVKKLTPPPPHPSTTASPPHHRRCHHRTTKHKHKSRFISKFFRTISQMGVTKKHTKRKKPFLAKTGVDRITNLHESVLSNILSRLSTKDAVRTSILSKDWKFKWVLMDNVDTDLESWGTGSSFKRFLDGILISHEHLRSFRSSFWRGMADNVQEWMNAAVRHNLEYLDVNINDNALTVPVSLLNSNSLRELKMVQPFPSLTLIKVNVADKNCAPNLTRLCLHDIVLVNENLDSSSVSIDFPVLEMLEFRGNTFSCGKWKNVKSVEINAPSLTSFSFEPTRIFWFRGHDCSIKIVAPMLTRFTCFNGFPENLILDWSSIVFAFLVADEDGSGLIGDYGLLSVNLVNAFINLEELTLSCWMAEVMWYGPPLHHHDKLIRLTLFSGCNADQLFMLLHAMPLLKFISVNVDYWEDYDYEAMKIIPSCITSCLEEVVLQAFSGNVPQYDLAEFLLKTAKKLKKFTITTYDVGLSEEMTEVLSAFGGCSPSLEISSLLPDIEHTYTRESIQG